MPGRAPARVWQDGAAMSDGDDKYAAYPETVLELPGVPDGRIDLRRPVGDAERATLAHVGLDAKGIAASMHQRFAQRTPGSWAKPAA